MDAYIINLLTSTDRRSYMEQVMNAVKELRPVFIEAVNGRALSEEELAESFNQEEAYRHYGRHLIPAEVGCTLSHRKCAETLLASDSHCAMVLEDDVIWQKTELGGDLSAIEGFLDNDKPMIVLLSGDYWYTRTQQISGGVILAKIWDAVCAQAYILNRAAAKQMLSMDKWYLADDWFEVRNAGIDIYALKPHIADQNRSDVHTVIAEQYGGLKRKNLSTKMLLRSYWRSMVDKILVYSRHFEAKSFKW